MGINMAQIMLEEGEEAVKRKVTKDGRITGLGRYAERKATVIILKAEDKKGGGEKG